MRVALVAQPFDSVRPPFFGSIGMWLNEVAGRLAASCEVVVYAGANGQEARELREGGVTFRLLPEGWDRWAIKALRRLPQPQGRPYFSSSLCYGAYIRAVARDLDRQACDVVHLINFSQFVPAIKARHPRTKVILNMRCEWLTQLDPTMIAGRLERADLVLGCSDYVTQEIRASFPPLAERCRTLHNGVDVERFSPLASPPLASLKARTGRQRILFVGRVSPEKGVHELLEAFARLLAHQPETELVIVGPAEVRLPREYLLALTDKLRIRRLESFYTEKSESSYLEDLRGMVRSLELEGHVTFAGPVPHGELADHYRAADLFVFAPIWDEPFGVPPIEAMAAGVPVVATRSGGISETVVDGETGLLVEGGDVAALAEAMRRLLADDDLRLGMGRAGRQRALALFSFDRVARDLARHYAELAAQA